MKSDNFEGMTLKGVPYYDKAVAGEKLLELIKGTNPDKEVFLGEYRGFELSYKYLPYFGNNYHFYLSGEESYHGELGTNTLGNITRLDNVINKIPNIVENARNELKALKEQFENAKLLLNEPFEKADELLEKTLKLNEINNSLAMDNEADRSIKELFEWFKDYDYRTINVTTDKAAYAIELRSSFLVKALALDYAFSEPLPSNDEMLKVLVNKTDEEIYQMILMNNPEELEEIKDNIKYFKFFMENFEKTFFVRSMEDKDLVEIVLDNTDEYMILNLKEEGNHYILDRFIYDGIPNLNAKAKLEYVETLEIKEGLYNSKPFSFQSVKEDEIVLYENNGSKTKMEKLAVKVGTVFTFLSKEEIKDITLEKTDREISVDGKKYALYKGKTFDDSQKLDTHIDLHKKETKVISEYELKANSEKDLVNENYVVEECDIELY